jgi:hydroxymethylpyrimidine pyrophosphatase-like HAD family hydrolase
MAIKAIFFDYSNVLAKDNQDINNETKKALKKLKGRGIIMGIVSGLPSSFVWAKGNEIGFHFYGGENGAEGFSPVYGFSITLAEKSFRAMKNLASLVESKCGELIWWQPNQYTKTIKPRPTTTRQQLKKIYRFIKREVKNLKLGYRVYLYEDAIDILPPNISKSRLIKEFLLKIKAMGIDIEEREVAVVGDSLADIEMLQEFGYPATTANASQKVKKIVKMKNGFISKKSYGKGVVEIVNWVLQFV